MKGTENVETSYKSCLFMEVEVKLKPQLTP